ncbi:hypothetical protein TorRG33x02_255680 [Trema orientale]|uniref:Uncharacterized protein n=1 Tax=Trema orientale TaxID=63057 RepID=A0A2P5DCA7_TREOI|nr:hypothetical protein TorRG33x02_255680 [Trema orientale]
MSSEKKEGPGTGTVRRLSCSACFDALWFCYSPVHQMQQYYRLGTLDNCSPKWSAFIDCLTLKTKSASHVQIVTNDSVECGIGCSIHCRFVTIAMKAIKRVEFNPTQVSSQLGSARVSCIPSFQEILGTREKTKPHIWSLRTPEEASSYWREIFGHLDDVE